MRGAISDSEQTRCSSACAGLLRRHVVLGAGAGVELFEQGGVSGRRPPAWRRPCRSRPATADPDAGRRGRRPGRRRSRRRRPTAAPHRPACRGKGSGSRAGAALSACPASAPPRRRRRVVRADRGRPGCVPGLCRNSGAGELRRRGADGRRVGQPDLAHRPGERRPTPGPAASAWAGRRPPLPAPAACVAASRSRKASSSCQPSSSV